MKIRKGILVAAPVAVCLLAILITVRLYMVDRIADELLAAGRVRAYPTMTIADLRQQLYANGYKIEGDDGAVVSYDDAEAFERGRYHGLKYVTACADIGPRVAPFFVERWIALKYEFDMEGHYVGIILIKDYYHPRHFVAPGDVNPWGRE